ncbi:MAG: hypothetical protein HY719_04010 [Planctomycetes bacterium]|nr:hypothetical protein [Planctomycetota bacterium]
MRLHRLLVPRRAALAALIMAAACWPVRDVRADDLVAQARKRAEEARRALDNAAQMARIVADTVAEFGAIPDSDVRDAVNADLRPAISREVHKRLVPPLKDTRARRRLAGALDRAITPVVTDGAQRFFHALSRLARGVKR